MKFNFDKSKLLEMQKHNLHNLCRLREDNFYKKFLLTFNDYNNN